MKLFVCFEYSDGGIELIKGVTDSREKAVIWRNEAKEYPMRDYHEFELNEIQTTQTQESQS